RAFGRLWTRLRDAGAPELQRVAAVAMFNRANALARGPASAPAIRAYDAVIKKFGRSRDFSTLTAVAMAMFNKGGKLRDLGRVASAQVNLGVTLGQRGHFDEEITVYEDVINRLIDTMDCDLQNSLAMALIKKGITLGRLGHAEAELHLYEQVVELFGEATRSEL